MGRLYSYNNWFCPLNDIDGRSPNLFCFPYAGADSFAYAQLAASLDGVMSVWSLQLPGRWPRYSEPPYDNIYMLTEAMCKDLHGWPDMPFAFFGHSMGSVIAYEFAHVLQRSYAKMPSHIFVSAHRAPHLPLRHPPLHNMSDDELLVELYRLDGTPKEALHNEELMRVMMPRIRADAKLIETYAYADSNPLPCPITAIGGSSDHWVSEEEIHAWSKHTKCLFSAYMLPGNHFYLRHAVEQVTNVIMRGIELDAQHN